MTDIERRLTEQVVEELIIELLDEHNALSVRQMAFNTIIGSEGFQVQIIVTRDETDFLEHFQTEVVEPFDK